MLTGCGHISCAQVLLLLLLLLLQGVDYLFSPELSGMIDSAKSTTCMDLNSTACSGTGLDAGSHGEAAVQSSGSMHQTCALPDCVCQLLPVMRLSMAS
jgi:hypothetical protein